MPALQALADTERDLLAATSAAMTAVRMPLALNSAFGATLVELKENLDLLRLPENTSAQFFEELINEPECICGRDMTEGARHEIITRSKRYLDADESGTINALKSDIDKFASSMGDEPLDEKLDGIVMPTTWSAPSASAARASVSALSMPPEQPTTAFVKPQRRA